MSAKARRCVVGGALAFIFFLTVACVAQDNAAGAASFKAKCQTCHGADGAGSPLGKSLKVPDLGTPEVQSKSDAELIQFISEGKGNMPSFKSSTKEDELKAIVAHLRTFAKK